MIEVEQKFLLSTDEYARLIGSQKPDLLQTITDAYYDSPQYTLTTKDWWLRKKNGRFELKVPVTQNPNTKTAAIRQYHEITSVREIYTKLQIVRSRSLDADLQTAGFIPYAQWTSTRKTYWINEFRLDIDETDFGHTVMEIELLVNDQRDVPAATQKIVTFAQEKKLSMTPVDGKNVAYLKKNNPHHYQALVTAGVV